MIATHAILKIKLKSQNRIPREMNQKFGIPKISIFASNTFSVRISGHILQKITNFETFRLSRNKVWIQQLLFKSNVRIRNELLQINWLKLKWRYSK